MPTRDMTCRIPASLQYLTALRYLVQALCVDTLGTEAPEEQVYQMQLAVSELATNIIVHAYRGRDAGAIEVRGTGDDARVTLEFWDTGSPYPMTPAALPPAETLAEGGYGSSIIQQCVDAVTYQREDERNYWRLEKRFGGKGGA